MKKVLFLLAGVCFATGVSAQKIGVITGSVEPLKEAGVIHFTYTYDNMRVGKMPEQEYVDYKTIEINEKEPGRGDYWAVAWVEDRTTRFQPKFEELFNKQMEPYGVIAGPEEMADFRIEINTDFTEPGFNVGVVRRNASVDLTLTIVNIATGETVGMVMIKESPGLGSAGFDFATGPRIQESYAKAGKEFAGWLIKTNKMKKTKKAK